jgi:hypothetical protein
LVVEGSRSISEGAVAGVVMVADVSAVVLVEYVGRLDPVGRWQMVMDLPHTRSFSILSFRDKLW